MRNADGRWEIDDSDGAIDGRSLLDRMTGENNSLSSGDVAGISIAATVVVGVISITVVIVAGRRIWQRRRRGYERLSGQIHVQQQPDTEGTHAINMDTSA